MNLVRWEPFKEADEFFRSFSPLFGRLPRMFENEGGPKYEWAQAADISEPHSAARAAGLRCVTGLAAREYLRHPDAGSAH